MVDRTADARRARPFRDWVEGAESASDLSLELACPRCRAGHRVRLSTLGRFCYECRGACLSGMVEDFRSLRAPATT